MADIRLWNVPEDHMSWGLQCAKHFGMQYPDRIGVRRGCGYTNKITSVSVYAYRTKSGQIVVRGPHDQ